MQFVQNEHSFCKRCITRHLRQSQNYPTCNELLTSQTLRPSRLVVNLLSQLKIPCKYAERGCPELIKQEMLQTHVRNCGFSPVQCSNAGCELIIDRKDRHQHEITQMSRSKKKKKMLSLNKVNNDFVYQIMTWLEYILFTETNTTKCSFLGISSSIDL